MAIEVFMPKAGMDMQEGKIVQWLKAVGDKVEEGEGLLEIETDKVNMEVEAPAAGVLLCQYFGDGDVVPVVTTIGYIGEAGEKVPDAAGESATATAEVAPVAAVEEVVAAPVAVSADGFIAASPLARSLAKENNIDLATVLPTGKWGEVKERDVLAAMEAAAASVQKVTPLAMAMAKDLGVDLSKITGTGCHGKITKEDVLAATQGAEPVAAPVANEVFVGERREKLSGMRKVVAERMTKSHDEIPSVTLNMKADVTKLMEVRQKINESREKADKISLNDFILKAVAIALQKHRNILVSVDGEDVVYKDAVNIGMAVAVPNGLIVPVLKNVDGMSLGVVSKTAKDLAVRARDGKLTMDEYKGSTFTISNLGMFEVESFTPIINQPDSGILGVCAVVEEVKRVNGEFVVCNMMGLSFTHDHRVIDGAPAAEFLRAVKHLLQDPMEIIVN